MRKVSTIIAALALSLGAAAGQKDSLILNFQDPPGAYRPQVWWHWMNGNITREGIRKDIEWMDAMGISGFHVFDAGFDTPQIVPKRLPYMTEGWKDAFRYALDLADSLGMKVAITSSPGWSLTGGPWVSEDDAMKKLTWSETLLDGGSRRRTLLREPDRVLDYYRDVAVIAVRTSADDTLSRAVPIVVRSEEKAGFVATYNMRDFFPTPDSTRAIAPSDIMDVTRFFRDGTLAWRAPSGRWRIYRFGYTLTGKKNGPASPEATGLEVDKFDPGAVGRYFDTYYKMYDEASGGRLGSTITSLMVDSYESRCQNWTEAMPLEFCRRRGYSLTPWLPALAGQVVGSAAETERFLYDFRRTCEELMSDYHYDGMNAPNARYGLRRFTEAQEYSRVYNADGMDVRRTCDVPMASFWMREFYSSYPCDEADMREAASVAHIYGQNICAGESFTTNGEDPDCYGRRVAWALCPANMKAAADAAMASGQNFFVIHSTVHQPVESKVPGLNLGKHGSAFNRLNTWAAEARPWVDYLSRSSYLLSQGSYVADLAVYYSETTNAVARFKRERPDVPEGYSYDFVNKTLMSSGRELPYCAIIIDKEVKYMSLPVLRRLAELARSGVILAGGEPETHCDLMGDEAEFEALVRDIWHSGRENVVPRSGLEKALSDAGVVPDVLFDNPSGADIRFVHRHLTDGELYWIANINPDSRRLPVSLRVCGRKPLLLDAETGEVSEASYRFEGGRTVVTLDLVRDDAVFVLLGEETEVRERAVPAPLVAEAAVLGGPWHVRFQPGRGAPESAVLDTLDLLSNSPVPGIRYFSGTATYAYSFDWSAEAMPLSGPKNRGEGPAKGIASTDRKVAAERRPKVAAASKDKVILDLGKVYDLARVRLNGVDLGVVWKEPFVVDVTGALQEGVNNLEIEVTNTWHNRIIGDLQPGAEQITYTTHKFYDAASPLRESGLAGPVRLIIQKP